VPRSLRSVSQNTPVLRRLCEAFIVLSYFISPGVLVSVLFRGTPDAVYTAMFKALQTKA
jgi:hypothetical protein